jgi:outer membrane protein assembly factor BamB
VDRETGKIQWRFFARNVLENGPLIAGDTVYIGSWSGAVHGVDLESGEERWRFQTGTWVTASPVLSPDGDSVLAASEDGTLYAFAR